VANRGQGIAIVGVGLRDTTVPLGGGHGLRVTKQGG
jgi:hypothetical protein